MKHNLVHIGVVGLGTLGSFHARTIATSIPGARLQALCSIRQEELDTYSTEFSIKQCYTDFDEMIAKEDLDAVVIASTSESHYAQAVKALHAGLHVFIEKPVALTLEDSLALQSLVHKHPQQVFMIGFMRRFDEPYQYAKDAIDKGHIGKPYFIRAYSHDCIKVSKRILNFSKGSGGLYIDVAIHDIDLMRWYLGAEAHAAYSGGGCYVFEELKKQNDQDNACAFINFQGGAMGFLFVGRTIAHGYHIETEIVGSEGFLRIGSLPERNNVALFTTEGVRRSWYVNFLDRFGDAYTEEIRSFVQAIHDGQVSPYAATIDDAVQSFSIALACTQSLTEDKLTHLEDINARSTT